MDLVTDHVVQLDHMHHTDRRALFKWLTVATIEQLALAVAPETSFFELIRDRFVTDAVK